MTKVQINIFACFMGFAILSIFNVNNSFANDHSEKTIIKEKTCKVTSE